MDSTGTKTTMEPSQRYFLFALGWVVYGRAGLRAPIFPRVISASMVVAGVLGFQ
jgi:hypothetical protein